MLWNFKNLSALAFMAKIEHSSFYGTLDIKNFKFYYLRSVTTNE